MNTFVEKLFAGFWNRFASRHCHRPSRHGLRLGFRVRDDDPTRDEVEITQTKRPEHLAILGKTGRGKSSLIRYLSRQDVDAGRGFTYFDLHGDATPFLLGSIAAAERRAGCDLSDKLIVIEPADPTYSVGLNPLEGAGGGRSFVQISEFAEILKRRWHLESFGARTDELLRNSLCALADNELTLLEIAPFLSHAEFRASCLKRITNAEIRQYFELRYDPLSEPMRAVMREPILNKTSAFTADPHFRHIVGQRKSTFSWLDALDQGRWVLLNLHKGRLGEQAATLGSLFLAVLKNALFARKSHELYTLYCDEIQNLVAYGSGLDTVLSEARKFSVSVTSANQFLDQYPPEMRSAILAVGTHIFFQLSSADAQLVSMALDGGRPLAELLKNLPQRHLVVKSGSERWKEVLVPAVHDPQASYQNLYERCRRRWGRKRDEVEQEIAARQAIVGRSREEALHDWE
jgi:hypothetical protein